ncbi:hypothetical protein [Solimonas soli]|uniref:hypothetical protein n=1 Tax=Solimonas soli TaxID=413479 RepID=UPI0012F73FAF|nr:hypothetical protein [Solimonas soli]
MRAAKLRFSGVLSLGLLATAAHAAPAAVCAHPQLCSLLVDGAYGNYVIGTLIYVGNSAAVRSLVASAKARGLWKHLPTDAEQYVRRVKPVAIQHEEDGKLVTSTVFMEVAEFEAAPLRIGDLVRYTPHDGSVDPPPNDPQAAALFHGLTGCVATLCARDDQRCMSQYRSGLFAKKTGIQIDYRTLKPKSSGLSIDPVSLIPKQ